jgi:hypothetical protein
MHLNITSFELLVLVYNTMYNHSLVLNLHSTIPLSILMIITLDTALIIRLQYYLFVHDLVICDVYSNLRLFSSSVSVSKSL